jgi:ubiquinone/menaquinone biosynthesis C-methylase UbiE
MKTISTHSKAYASGSTKSAEQLHKNVPPDWYFKSIKRNLLQRWWHKSRFNEVAAVTEKDTNAKILDIGCADGMFTNVIYQKSQAKEIIAIDVLESSVEWAKKHWGKNKHLVFKVGNAHELNFKDNTFDAAYALEVLEHVHEPITVLREVKRVLKPGGYAVFLVPSDNMLFNIVWFFVRKFWWAKIWDDTHIQTYRNNYLVKVSEHAGFEIEVDKKFWLGMLHLVKVRKQK